MELEKTPSCLSISDLFFSFFSYNLTHFMIYYSSIYNFVSNTAVAIIFSLVLFIKNAMQLLCDCSVIKSFK